MKAVQGIRESAWKAFEDRQLENSQRDNVKRKMKLQEPEHEVQGEAGDGGDEVSPGDLEEGVSIRSSGLQSLIGTTSNCTWTMG